MADGLTIEWTTIEWTIGLTDAVVVCVVWSAEKSVRELGAAPNWYKVIVSGYLDSPFHVGRHLVDSCVLETGHVPDGAAGRTTITNGLQRSGGRAGGCRVESVACSALESVAQTAATPTSFYADDPLTTVPESQLFAIVLHVTFPVPFVDLHREHVYVRDHCTRTAVFYCT